MMRTALTGILLLISFSIIAQDKKAPISHKAYDSWKDFKNYKISRDGNLVIYEINPQKGDGNFYWYLNDQDRYSYLPRGSAGVISPSSYFIACRIKMPYDSIRKELLAGTRKKDLKKDSVAVIDLRKDTILRYPGLHEYRVSKKGADLVAFLIEQPSDTAVADSVNIKKKKKKKKTDLVVISSAHDDPVSFKDVEEFFISPAGDNVAFIRSFGDSIDSCAVHVYLPAKEQALEVFESAGFSRNVCMDHDGKQLAFHYSNDTSRQKVWSLRMISGKTWDKMDLIDSTSSGLPSGWSVSVHGKPEFSEDGKRLYLGTAPAPEPEVKDTLTEDEKVSVDIWNWKDLKLQSHQLKDLENEKKRYFLAVWHTGENKFVQLADEDLMDIRPQLKTSGKFVPGSQSKPYWKELSWESSRYRDVYLVDQQSGARKRVLKRIQSSYALSPNQDYIAWYNASDSSWYMYDIQSNSSSNMTTGTGRAFYNEENDVPDEAGHYGSAGWTEDNQFMVYDRHDIYLLDPKKGLAINITGEQGRKSNSRFKWVDLDNENPWIDMGKPNLLRHFDFENNATGYFSLDEIGEPVMLLKDDYNFSPVLKSEEADLVIWTRESFREYPDLWVSGLDFSQPRRITDANPQAKDYKWGNVEMVHWVSLNGDSLRGLLYLPEDLDTTKKYPMIVYFYEKYSDRLHKHYVPRPSRSVINFTYYTSNDYIIFVPDIVYRTGYPGQSCYDAVMAGTMKMLERPFIDPTRLGLQGQSWGGYQVAYLVTQTELFAAAMAGAPVSNMTSAYGGIRWGTGLSRMFQYEESQSRIGKTLWEDPMLYIENSPLFYADKVNTPLLIMHNDDDGAVPWYQGIEMFVAMRRLNKPCWMLTYNNAPHNLSRRADMEDLTVRMQQFFDHYLKNEPAPVWMEEGIPATEKGKEFGFEKNEKRK